MHTKAQLNLRRGARRPLALERANRAARRLLDVPRDNGPFAARGRQRADPGEPKRAARTVTATGCAANCKGQKNKIARAEAASAALCMHSRCPAMP